MKKLLALMMFMFTGAAQAADYTYAPTPCEFQATFPEEPAASEQCNPDKPKQCHKVMVYNKVYALDAAIKITITCTPATPGMMAQYSGDAMQFTLGSMAKNRVGDNAETGFQDYGTAKQAMLMGSKKQKDGTESVYMGQLWIGKTSVMTVEGEITGSPVTEADTLFAQIMKSVRPVAPVPTDKKEPEQTDAKKTDAKPPAAAP